MHACACMHIYMSTSWFFYFFSFDNIAPKNKLRENAYFACGSIVDIIYYGENEKIE